MQIRILASLSFLFFVIGAASGQELIMGWEGSQSNGYGFAMPVFRLPKDGTHSLVIRPSGSYLYYDFKEAGGFTAVTSPGADFGLAYRLHTQRLTFTIGPGIEARWDHRKKADGTQTDKTQLGATAQGDLFFQPNPLTSLALVGSYGHANRYVWSRAGFMRQVTNTEFRRNSGLQLGAEVTGQGNQDVRQIQAGGVIGVAFLHSHSSLQFRSGYARLQFADNSTEIRPYFGTGLYKAF
jgi:cellulose biosynthesis protein BcsS